MTTTVISTIRSSGGDYTSLSAWEAGEQGDITAAGRDEISIGECYDDWPSGLTNTVQINGWTTDSTHYIKVTVASGHRHDGKWGTGFFLVGTGTFTNVFDIREDYTELEWIAFDNNFTGGPNNTRSTYTSGITYATYRDCISRNSSNAYGYGFYMPPQGVAINCLSVNEYVGFLIGNGASKLYNCGAADSSYRCYSGGNAAAIVKNSFAYNGAANWAATTDGTNSSNNATSTGSDDAPGGSSVYGITSSAFVDAANDDFHLSSGSALIGAGTNLYSEFTTDIDGDTWPSSGAWDIGFDYRVAASPSVDLAGNAAAQAAAAAALTHAVPLAGAGLSVATAGGAMSVSIPLAGAAQSQADSTATLTTSGSAALAGNATAQASAAGGLSLSVTLAAAAVAQALASAGLAHGTPLDGAASGQASASGGLSVGHPLAGGAQSQASASGTLSLNISLSGAAISQAAASAGLTVLGSSDLAGNAAAAASASGALSHGVPLSGASVVVSNASGSLSQIVPLAGAAASASMATGGLDVAVKLSAAALAQALAAAGLSVTASGLAGAAAADATAGATLTLRVNLDGAAVANAIASGALSTAGLILAGTPGYEVTRIPRTWRIARESRTWRVAA